MATAYRTSPEQDSKVKSIWIQHDIKPTSQLDRNTTLDLDMQSKFKEGVFPIPDRSVMQ